MATDFISIASGQTVSGPFGTLHARQQTVLLPACTSGAVYVQVAGDTSSASFFRASMPTSGGAPFAWMTNSANAALNVFDLVGGATWARLQLASPTTAPTTATILSKF